MPGRENESERKPVGYTGSERENYIKMATAEEHGQWSKLPTIKQA